MELYLIRHGETYGNSQKLIYGNNDYPLTQKGYEQVKSILDYFNLTAERTIDLIFSSPKNRTKIIAEKLAHKYNNKVQEDNRIAEMHYGIFEGLTENEVVQKYNIEYQQFLNFYDTYVIPNGEGYFQFKERIKRFTQEISTCEGTCVVVTHGGVIREMMMSLLEIKPEGIWDYWIDPGCIVHLTYKKDKGILHQIYNQTDISNNEK